MPATKARKLSDITPQMEEEILSTPLWKLSKTELTFICGVYTGLLLAQ